MYTASPRRSYPSCSSVRPRLGHPPSHPSRSSFGPLVVVTAVVAALLSGCGNDARACATRVSLPAEARSCELLLEDTGAGVREVSFGGGVVGEWIRQAPRTAIALHATRDAAMGGDAITVSLEGDGGYVVVSSQCFDGDSVLVESDTFDQEDGCHE